MKLCMVFNKLGWVFVLSTVHADVKTCKDVRVDYGETCCGKSSDTIVDVGFDSAKFTQLHSISSSWPRLPFYFELTVPISFIRFTAIGAMASVSAADHPRLAQGGLFHLNGTKILEITHVMDPLLLGTDKETNRPYFTINPHFYTKEVVCATKCKESYYTYVGLTRFNNDDPTEYFKEAVLLGLFVPENDLYLDERLTTRFLARSYDEGFKTINGSKHVSVKHDIRQIPDGFNLQAYSSFVKTAFVDMKV